MAGTHLHRSTSYRDVDKSLEQWQESSLKSLELKQQHPDRVILVDFRSLVADTERVMRKICAIVGMGFEEILLNHTFNRIPILSDSAFEARKDIDRDVLDRESALDPEIRRKINSYAASYARCDAHFVNPRWSGRGDCPGRRLRHRDPEHGRFRAGCGRSDQSLGCSLSAPLTRSTETQTAPCPALPRSASAA
ncbi:MAG: hypothetical protein KBG29_18730 [Pseudomonadales bacterium]|nr:hypothetical protein [Pseudomonadales bacterium]